MEVILIPVLESTGFVDCLNISLSTPLQIVYFHLFLKISM